MASMKSFGFLLIDGFALMSYASAVEPLRAANALSGMRLYDWSHISTAGSEIIASNGLAVAADHTIADKARYDTIIVCAGGNPTLFDDAKTIAWLRRLGRTRCEIGGVSGGPFILARAGLLQGVQCTIHWEHAPAFAETFPDIDLTQTLFEIDRGRLTCGGGVAALDLMHAIIRRDHGPSLAGRVSDWYLQTAVRMGDSTQRIALRERLGTNNRSLIAAISAMERQIGIPASRDELARAAGVSVRQLERLFVEHLGVTIHRHYVSLRLKHARTLLRQTGLPLSHVATECGFPDPSHFARVYRNRYSSSPSTDRAAMMKHDDRKKYVAK